MEPRTDAADAGAASVVARDHAAFAAAVAALERAASGDDAAALCTQLAQTMAGYLSEPGKDTKVADAATRERLVRAAAAAQQRWPEQAGVHEAACGVWRAFDYLCIANARPECAPPLEALLAAARAHGGNARLQCQLWDAVPFIFQAAAGLRFQACYF